MAGPECIDATTLKGIPTYQMSPPIIPYEC